MDAFSYLSVLLSTILGLAITQILKGMRGWVLSRGRIVSYWPTVVMVVLLLLICVQSWWAMFGMRDIQAWTFGMFAMVLLQTTITYMLAALVLPDFFGTETIDLRAHFYAHRQLFFGLFVLVLLVSLAKDWVLDGHASNPVNVGFHCGFIALALGGALISREWYHKFFCLVAAVAFVVYIVVLFAKLR